MQPSKFLGNHRIFLTIGVLFAIGGFILLFTSPIVFEYIISSELLLSPSKRTYDVWKKTPMPIGLEFYFFNWTNSADLRNTSVKLRFEQLGPYRFQETKEKVNVVWNDNGTVTFKQLKYWYFDAANSNGSLTDQVTSLNAVAAAASTQAKKFGYLMQTGLSFSMNSLVKKVHVTKTVNELLFEGYKDPLIDVAKSMPSLAGVDLPPFDKFGWFYSRNGSADFDGVITMGTGMKDLPVGFIDQWNYNNYTRYFDGECGRVTGSAGEFWPEYVTKDYITMFSPDLCRKIDFEFDSEVDVYGIKGYKFVGGQRSIDNGTLYPGNKCFNSGNQIPSGLMNVSSCRYGSPSFISFPHFYNADPVYLENIEGLSPNKELHELSITLEPRTGIPLSVAARFQLSILLEPNENIRLFSDVPRIFFPMLWFEQKVTIPKEMALSLKQGLYLPTIGRITSIVVLSCGLIILLSLFTIHSYQSLKIYFRNKQVNRSHFAIAEQMPLRNSDIKEHILPKKIPA